jgi:hypothetical protein
MWKVCKPVGAPVGTLKVIVKLNVSSGGERRCKGDSLTLGLNVSMVRAVEPTRESICLAIAEPLITAMPSAKVSPNYYGFYAVCP